jgi:hypothetical protein
MRRSRTLSLAAVVAAIAAGALAVPTMASASAPLDVTGSIDPSSVSFPDMALGDTSAPQVFTLTNNGTDPMVIGGAADLTGTDADSFVITDDQCEGQTLATTDTCTVSVEAYPRIPGSLSATLDVPDNSVSGAETAALAVNVSDKTHGLYYKVPSARLLDTRSGNGAAKHPVKPGGVVALQVLGRGHVPSTGVSAVVLNVTITRATSGGHITVYPSGQARPIVSSINYPKAWTGANLVTVPVGADGKVDLYSSGGTDLVADVQGWYASSDTVSGAQGVGGSYFPNTTPDRLIDTRYDFGKDDPLPSGYYTEVAAYYDSSIDPSSIHALAIVLTATRVHAGGYMTATDVNNDPTKTSTLNLQTGVTTPNLAVVSTEPCSESWCTVSGLSSVVFQVFNGSSKPVDFIADLQGAFFDDTVSNLRFRPVNPTRIVDTRIPRGTTKLGPASTHTVVAPASVVTPNSWALSANLTAVQPSARTVLTVWPNFAGQKKPNASNLNPLAGTTVASGALIGIADNFDFNIYNNTGSTNVLVDVSGSYDEWPAPLAPAKAGVAAQRSAAQVAQSAKAAASAALTARTPHHAGGAPSRAWAE